MVNSLSDKLVALPSAKSKLWNYFGFPVSSSGTITDKTNVYCKFCDPPFSISYSTNKYIKSHVSPATKSPGGVQENNWYKF